MSWGDPPRCGFRTTCVRKRGVFVVEDRPVHVVDNIPSPHTCGKDRCRFNVIPPLPIFKTHSHHMFTAFPIFQQYSAAIIGRYHYKKTTKNNNKKKKQTKTQQATQG